MIYPIVAYGDPVLKKKCENISTEDLSLKDLISNMFETMNNANGVGLAAPQIGKNIRLFIVDSNGLISEDGSEKGLKEVFINAQVIEEYGTPWEFEEGCLSIPNIRANVERNSHIKITYYDANFNKKTKIFDGLTARVIQHEYDHIEGILFVDHLKPLKRKRLAKQLKKISEGNVGIHYKMSFPNK